MTAVRKRCGACATVFGLLAAGLAFPVDAMPAAGVPVGTVHNAAISTDTKAVPPENLGTHRVLVNGVRLEVMVREVAVADGLTTLTFTVHDPRENGHPVVVGDVFTGLQVGAAAEDGAESGDRSSQAGPRPGGVSLIDSASGKVYYMVVDAQGTCLCAQKPAGQSLLPGQMVTFSVSFAALPREVKTVSVAIPIAGVYLDIPVQHSGSSATRGAQSQGGGAEPVKRPIHAPIVDSIFVAEDK